MASNVEVDAGNPSRKRPLPVGNGESAEVGSSIQGNQQQTGWESATLSSDGANGVKDVNTFQLPTMGRRRKRTRQYTPNLNTQNFATDTWVDPATSTTRTTVPGSSSGRGESLGESKDRTSFGSCDPGKASNRVEGSSSIVSTSVLQQTKTRSNDLMLLSSVGSARLNRSTSSDINPQTRKGTPSSAAASSLGFMAMPSPQLSPIDHLCMAVCRSDNTCVDKFLRTYPKSVHAKTKPLSELLKSRGSIGASVVYIAAKYRNMWALEKFIDRGADVNIPNSGGVTPLYIAGHYGYLEIVEALCKAGGEVERAKTDGATVTYSACKHGHLDVVKMLVKYGARTERSRKKNGMSLLHVAAQHGHTELVKYLIEDLKADTNQPTITGGTALHLACFQKRLDTVKLLIKYGADVDVQDRAGGWTALHIATQQGNVDIVREVLCAPCCPGSDSLPLIPEDQIRRKLEGPVPDGFSSREEYTRVVVSRLWRTKDDGYSLLMVSCRTGRSLPLTKYLLQMGADDKQKLNDGSTPFLIAAKHGRLSHVEFFIQREQDREKLAYHMMHHRPQHQEYRKLRKKMERQELNFNLNGSVVSQVSQNGWTALHWAARGGFVKMVQALIEADLIDLNKTVNSGMTALYIASHHGHLEVVKTLVKAGVDIDRSMVNGASPLYTACKHGKLKVAEYLLANGANLQVTNSRGSSPLHTACNHNHPEVVKFLVRKAGADPSSTKGQEGWMAIHIACRVGALEIVKFLVEEAKVDITTKTEDYGGVMGGFAALHLAASHGRMKIVRYLVGMAGARVDIPSSTNITPSELAMRRNRHDVKVWLDRAGGGWTPLMFAVDRRDRDEVLRLLRTDGLVRDVSECTPLGDSALTLAALGSDGDATEEESDDASAPANRSTPWMAVDKTILDIVQRAALPYYPGNHNLYPKCVRDTGMTIMGVSYRLHILPKELWLVIMSYIGRNFDD